MVSRYYLGWPLHLHEGNSDSENLTWETQRQKCYLYETLYIAASAREQGDVIARTLPYARLPLDAPTRTRFFFGSGVTRFSRDPSHLSIGSFIPFLRRSNMWKQYHKRTTLRSKSSTIKVLLYAHDREKRKKGTLSDQPWLLCVTSMVLLCCWGQ
jgi:hypothetical protein